MKAGYMLSPRLTALAPLADQQEAEATMAEAEVEASQRLGMFRVEAILDERQSAKRGKKNRTRTEFLVQWEGYDVAWEEHYRQGRGQVGDPFSTWEPESSLKDLNVLAAWKTAHPPPP